MLTGNKKEATKAEKAKEAALPSIQEETAAESVAAHADPAMKEAAHNLKGLAPLKLFTQRRARASRAPQTSLTSLNRIGTSHINLPSEDFCLAKLQWRVQKCVMDEALRALARPLRR